MYNILKVEDSVQGYVSLTLLVDSETKQYTVRSSVYLELGSPVRGDALGDVELDTLILADEYYRAKRAALSILSYGDNNKKTLATKLRARSISEPVAREVVIEMCSLGYIDEGRQLRRLIVEDVNRKLLGPKKVVPRLLAKGYSLSDIKDIYEELVRSGEIDIEESREKLVSKHLGDKRDGESVKRLLFKYGYDF